MPKKQTKQIPEIDINRGMAVISYLFCLCLIPLLLKSKDKFVYHHAKQGLVLFIFEIIIIVVGLLPLIGWLVSFLGLIFAVLMSIMGILNALAGRMWEMPVLGKYKGKIDL